ncbi:Outer membrane protein OprM precursor [Legionella massiliensis]|uniref:Outer membrane protein OprM n=1 Tax=Legionella massiliensis TaxID=1034943 RepID=A0A078L0R1_9GAMM|nr:efflux transporter outer membrane subunit [Legionella massiliensis]CDZ78832.1 Outer membrane protein OprM precursor [Legionella massiliensis]CEE14570.1 Outer membrane protein OprM precursor [Legionella massiliensis]
MDIFRPRISRAILIILTSVCMTACKVGPNFRKPDAPPVKGYEEKPLLPAKTASSPTPGGDSQRFLKDKDVPLLWWELFRSPELNQLVRRGLAHSPTIAAANAALRQAQENLNVQIGNLMLPAVDAVGTAQRQRYSTTGIGGIGGGDRAFTFNLYNASVNASYTLDVWGGNRRQIESYAAQVDYQQFQVIATYLTLTSNIVTTAVAVASYQAQIDVTIQLINEQQKVYNILNKQYQLGAISNASVLTQQTLLEQTKATLPPLQKSLSQNRHALAALVGTFPDEPLPLPKLDNLKLPVNIPVSLPSMLVRQRPDVRAAEATMHAACAQIGVATANLLPQITLSGSYGYVSSQLSNLFTGPNNIWSILAQAAQPLFHGGALLAQRRANIAAFQQTAAQYKQTVLQAFENVADVLRALETDARALRAQVVAENSARQALNLTIQQYRLGGASYIALLNTQQQYEQTRINRIQAQATRFADTAALFQALGGGWWHKPWCVNECL